MAKWRFLKSVGLAATTVVLIGLIDSTLRYSPVRDRITDALEIPALWILSLFFPQGIHTGSGVPHWVYYAFAANLGVYTLFWYACLNFGHYLFPRRNKSRNESNGL